MGLPTDRGIVFVKDEDNGTKTVIVCAGVRQGVPTDVYAAHFRRTSVVIDPAIKLVDAGSARYTDGIAEVSSDGQGVVYISRIRSGRRLQQLLGLS